MLCGQQNADIPKLKKRKREEVYFLRRENLIVSPRPAAVARVSSTATLSIMFILLVQSGYVIRHETNGGT